MPFTEFASAGYVPDLDEVFVCCFSDATSDTLYDSGKTLARLK
jgi:hypothetical protein